MITLDIKKQELIKSKLRKPMQTLLNILSAKGIIYTYYKNKKLTQGKNNG